MQRFWRARSRRLGEGEFDDRRLNLKAESGSRLDTDRALARAYAAPFVMNSALRSELHPSRHLRDILVATAG
jgi:hypothetical protein